MQISRLIIALVFSWLTSIMLGHCLSDSRVFASDRQSTGRENAEQDESADREAEQKDAEPNDGEKAGNDSVTADVAIQPSIRNKGEATDADLIAAVQAGPRALSLAFRMAAKRATGSVVVLFAYGQGDATAAEGKNTEESDQDKLPLLERAEIPSKPPQPVPPQPSDLPPNPDKLTGLGSGVIVSDDGLIMTNNHVIKGASRVVVQLPDETWIDAEIIRGDPDSDVGIVRIKPTTPLQPVAIGDSDRLEIGDWVLAIGSPFKLQATVSAGIISAKDRRIDKIPRSNMLQTDAAINPGNSGGALIDLNGEVIGISTAIATRTGFYQGVGFAIPINQAVWIAEELDQHGEVRRAAIGTTLVDLKPRIAKQFQLPPYSGILVYQVIKDSVAEKAGIERLDVIVEFAGEQVRDSTTLQRAIERQKIGSEHPIVVRRGGDLVELTVQLATVDDPTGGE